jgi:hypothetical protein
MVMFKNISEWKPFPSESAVEEPVRLVKAINYAKAKKAEKEGSRPNNEDNEELPFKTAIIFEQSEPASSVSYKIRMDNGGWDGSGEIFSTTFMTNNFKRLWEDDSGKQIILK